MIPQDILIGKTSLPGCPADTENFQIRFDELEKLINKNTKAVVINSPNNPSGTVYSEDTIKKLAAVLGD